MQIINRDLVDLKGFVNVWQEHSVIAVAGQKNVALPGNSEYRVGQYMITVYVDGKHQRKGSDYVETDSKTITFPLGLHAGAEVYLRWQVPFTETLTGNVKIDVANVLKDIPENGIGVAQVQGLKNALSYVDELAINVKDFGAKGDGVTDDTGAIQQALNFVKGEPSCKVLYFPPGKYIISSGLIIYSEITIQGAGHNSIIKLKNNANNNIDMLSIVTTGNRDITIRDIKIDGNKEYQVRQNHTTCIKAHEVKNLLLDNVMVVGSLIEGVYLYKCTNVRVTRCITTGNGFPQEDASGIHIDTCKNVLISNCISAENGFHGFIFSSAEYVIMSDCIANNNGWDGIRLQYTTMNCKITNFLAYFNFRGIYLTTDSNTNSITGSTIKDNNLGIGINESYDNSIASTYVLKNNTGIEAVAGWEVNYVSGVLFKNNVNADTTLPGDAVLTPMGGTNLMT